MSCKPALMVIWFSTPLFWVHNHKIHSVVSMLMPNKLVKSGNKGIRCGIYWWRGKRFYESVLPFYYFWWNKSLLRCIFCHYICAQVSMLMRIENTDASTSFFRTENEFWSKRMGKSRKVACTLTTDKVSKKWPIP